MALKELECFSRLSGTCDAKPELRRFIAENFGPIAVEPDVFRRPIVYGVLYVNARRMHAAQSIPPATHDKGFFWPGLRNRFDIF